MTPPIRPSSIQTSSPARTSSNTCDDVHPIVAGFNTRPTLSHAATRPRCQLSGQDKQITSGQRNRDVDGRNPTDRRLSTGFGPLSFSPDADFAGEVTGPRGLGPAAVGADGRDIEHALGLPGIREGEMVTDRERLQKRPWELEAGIGWGRRPARRLL